MNKLSIMLAMIVGADSLLFADATNKPATAQLELEDKLQAVRLLAHMGRWDEAEARCEELLVEKPDQPTVKKLLREVDGQRHRLPGPNLAAELRRQIEELIVPEVNVRNGDPLEVIEFLRAQSKSLTPDRAEINFVWQVPPEHKLGRVTLSLRNVPVADAIRYVADGAGLRYRVDPHAVVIFTPEPPGLAKGSPPPAESPP